MEVARAVEADQGMQVKGRPAAPEAGQPQPERPGREPAALLVAEEIVVDYHAEPGKRLRAVDHVSFEVGAGEVFGIVGESGSGKSTLGKVVAGFIRPNHGRVLVADGKTGQLEERARRHPQGYRDIQMVFQESAAALDPRLPVWKLIGEALRPDRALSAPWSDSRKGLRETVLAQLGHYGLGRELIDKRPGELSGGEKQRVAVARAMLAAPALVVCDEAVSSLDVSIRAVILNLFKRLREETGVALLFISHDIAVVAHLADRVMVMRNGKNVETGVVAQVIDEPADPYTQKLIAAVPRLER
jgi:peptide/nickel transport system ATP-binding protein